MPTLRFPLVGSFTNRTPNMTLADTTDQFFVNCFPEVNVNPITGKKTVVLNKRQGFTASSDVSAGASGSWAAFNWTGFAAANAAIVVSFVNAGGVNEIYSVSGGSVSQLGSDITGTAGVMYLDETTISGTANITAALADSGTTATEAWFFPKAGAWTQITDGDFPSSITAHHAHLDGYMFVMTESGRIYNSDINSLANWTAANYITANSFSDGGVGCVRYKDMIVGFGDYSVEFFVNAGNATGSVLRRLDNATLRVGARRTTAVRPPTMRSIHDTIYWIGQDGETGSPGVYRLKGMVEEKISNVAIDRLVGAGRLNWLLGGFSMFGMKHVAFHSTNQPASTLCFCVDTGFWWIFTPASSLQPRAFVGGIDSSNESVSVFTADAKVYTCDPSSPVWQDNAVAYTMTAQTENMDLDTDRRKFFRKLRMTYDRQASTSPISISSSDDDYATSTSLGSIDTISSNPMSWITRLGSAPRRSWKFTHAADTPCRIQAVEVDYDVGDK